MNHSATHATIVPSILFLLALVGGGDVAGAPIFSRREACGPAGTVKTGSLALDRCGCSEYVGGASGFSAMEEAGGSDILETAWQDVVLLDVQGCVTFPLREGGSAEFRRYKVRRGCVLMLA